MVRADEIVGVNTAGVTPVSVRAVGPWVEVRIGPEFGIGQSRVAKLVPEDGSVFRLAEELIRAGREALNNYIAEQADRA